VGKYWVLDTETKGTGAEMVPLEKAQRAPSSAGGLVVVRERAAGPAAEPAPKAPPRFKVVDVMTRQVLAEGADTRATVELLEGIRSVVDVSIYAWDSALERWQALGMGDRRKLFALAQPSSSATSASTR
jgi:hypothetical protein